MIAGYQSCVNMITMSPFFCLYPFSIHPFDNAVVKLNNLSYSPSTTLTDRVPLLLYPGFVKLTRYYQKLCYVLVVLILSILEIIGVNDSMMTSS